VVRHVVLWRRLPPLGARSRLVRRVRARPRRPHYPPWLAPDFAARLGLAERWEKYHEKAEEQERRRVHPTRHRAYRQFGSPFWTRTFEYQDPGETRVPIEVRHPFFDIRLVRFALALPAVPWCVRKTVMRLALPRAVPEIVRWRPKTPLAGDPRMARLREGGAAALEPFVPVPALARYVAGGAVLQNLVDSDPEDLWMNLRPRALNYWLRFARPEPG